MTWYSGEPGSGKSVLSLLLNRRIDPSFQPAVIAGDNRIAFNNLDFLKGTIPLQPGEVMDGDELSLFARGVMKAEQMALTEWLKDSRGRNLVVSMKFPDEALVDEKVILGRAHFRVHTWKDHTFRIFVPKEPHQRDDSRPFGNWREVFYATFPMISGPLYEAYKARKMRHMVDSNIRLAERLEQIEAKRQGKKGVTPSLGSGGVAPSTLLPAWDPGQGQHVPGPSPRPTPPERRPEGRQPQGA